MAGRKVEFMGYVHSQVLGSISPDIAPETLELDPPQSAEVLIDVAACGVCHTDLHVIKQEVEFPRSEEHTSELQSRGHLVCRLLLEKKKKTQQYTQGRQHT